jgi:hypothetical protein
MGAVLPAVALYILVSVFSEGLESSVRWKILVIAIGSSLASAAVQALIGGIVGTLVGFAVALLLIFVALSFWCRVDRKATLKIVAAYAVFTVGLVVVIGFLRGVVVSS